VLYLVTNIFNFRFGFNVVFKIELSYKPNLKHCTITAYPKSGTLLPDEKSGMSACPYRYGQGHGMGDSEVLPVGTHW
jgi:hypothetical protein